jgi:hypothetical protein
MQAQEVLDRMVQRYAGLQSYSDVGHVTLTHPNFVTRTPFTTFYKAPSLFRFDFNVPHPHPPLSHIVSQHAVGFDGTNAYALRKAFKEKVESQLLNSIGLAVAGASGISSGAALTIGRLLLKGTEGLSISELSSVQLSADTAIDDVSCYSMTARYPSFGGKYHLLIEKHTSLLRKLLSEHETTRFEEIRCQIRINAPIEDAVFTAELKELSV